MTQDQEDLPFTGNQIEGIPRMLQAMAGKRFEIMETLDSSTFSSELKAQYISEFLPLLKKLVPQGKEIQIVFLIDPPRMEIRRPAAAK